MSSYLSALDAPSLPTSRTCATLYLYTKRVALMNTERISQDQDNDIKATIGERAAHEIDQAVAARLAANPDLARVLDETDEARDHAVRRIVADYLDELDRLTARFVSREDGDRYDGDGYSVRRLSPDEARRLGLDADESLTGTIYDSDEEFEAALRAHARAADHADV